MTDGRERPALQLNTLGLVHDFLRRMVKPGDFCIDATAGKGRDTALLCRLTGENGRVLAFDIQPEAVEQTKQLLQSRGLTAEVRLDSHANMEAYAPAESVDVIVFNFGRLPGGDVNIYTRADSSIAAIAAGLRLLKPGGFLIMALYYGGFNGYEERDAVLEYVRTLNPRTFSVLQGSWVNRPNDPPMPLIIWKEESLKRDRP